MADYQIGDNLYADTSGRYYSLNNGAKAYSQSPYEGTQEKINQMYETQRKNQLGLLKQQREKAVSGFNQQKKELAPQYQNQRNQADVVNAQNVTRLRELMAANGINASGENLTTQANMASSRQNALGEITNAENQAYSAIDRQIADVNDPSQELAINNAIEAERSRSLLDAYTQFQQQVMQQQKEWQALQLQRQQAAARARSGGSSGSSGASSTSTAKSTAAATTSNQSALDRYYSSPAIQAVEELKRMSPNNYALNKAFDEPVPMAQNPDLSAWAKMRMFGR
jgi:hypothetical protein